MKQHERVDRREVIMHPRLIELASGLLLAGYGLAEASTLMPSLVTIDDGNGFQRTFDSPVHRTGTTLLELLKATELSNRKSLGLQAVSDTRWSTHGQFLAAAAGFACDGMQKYATADSSVQSGRTWWLLKFPRLKVLPNGKLTDIEPDEFIKTPFKAEFDKNAVGMPNGAISISETRLTNEYVYISETLKRNKKIYHQFRTKQCGMHLVLCFRTERELAS